MQDRDAWDGLGGAGRCKTGKHGMGWVGQGNAGQGSAGQLCRLHLGLRGMHLAHLIWAGSEEVDEVDGREACLYDLRQGTGWEDDGFVQYIRQPSRKECQNAICRPLNMQHSPSCPRLSILHACTVHDVPMRQQQQQQQQHSGTVPTIWQKHRCTALTTWPLHRSIAPTWSLHSP